LLPFHALKVPAAIYSINRGETIAADMLGSKADHLAVNGGSSHMGYPLVLLLKYIAISCIFMFILRSCILHGL